MKQRFVTQFLKIQGSWASLEESRANALRVSLDYLDRRSSRQAGISVSSIRIRHSSTNDDAMGCVTWITIISQINQCSFFSQPIFTFNSQSLCVFPFLPPPFKEASRPRHHRVNSPNNHIASLSIRHATCLQVCNSHSHPDSTPQSDK